LFLNDRKRTANRDVAEVPDSTFGVSDALPSSKREGDPTTSSIESDAGIFLSVNWLTLRSLQVEAELLAGSANRHARPGERRIVFYASGACDRAKPEVVANGSTRDM
jgi:hypothetical protein